MDGKSGAGCAGLCMSNPTGRATVGLTGTRRLAGLGGGCAFIRIKRDIKASASHHCCTCLARGKRGSPPSPEGGHLPREGMPSCYAYGCAHHSSRLTASSRSRLTSLSSASRARTVARLASSCSSSIATPLGGTAGSLRAVGAVDSSRARLAGG